MKFYQKTGFILLMLIFLFPVGIFLMWREKKFHALIRIILSVCSFIWGTLIILAFMAIANPKPYEPVVGQYESIYKSELNKASDGSFAIINVTKVIKDENNDINVIISAPSNPEILYAFNNYMLFVVKDEFGKTLKFDKATFTIEGDDAKITIKGEHEKAKWLKIGPYRDNENNDVYFKIE